MRLYDFHCTECGKDFEDLVTAPSDARCPACGTAKVDRQLSAFAVGGSSGEREPASFGGGGGGGCGAGGCGMGRCGLS